jgi:hypothetical protein
MAPRAVLCVVALVAILSSTASASRLFSGVEDFAWKAISLAGAHKEVAHTESSALSVTQLASSLEALVSGVEGPFDGPVHVTAEFFPAPSEWPRCSANGQDILSPLICCMLAACY